MSLSLFFNWAGFVLFCKVTFLDGLLWQWSHWYLMYLCCLCDLRLHHWHAIRSHRLHLNLVPTRLCVLSKCFWVSSWSHCSHLNSLKAKVFDQIMIFSSWKSKMKRNHQDKITFKHYPNLLATIFRTFRWSFLITLLTFILDSFILTLFMQD